MDARILIIDDDAKIAAMMRRGLSFEGFEVSVAASGKEGLYHIAQNEPDLVILDVNMPQMDGHEVCCKIRKVSRIPILMVTGRDSVADKVAGLEIGADDYLVKPFAFEELVARVRALLRRIIKDEGGEQLQFADLSLDINTREIKRGNRAIELSTTEYNLLLYLMSNPQKVLTRELLMEKVWGYDFQGESNVLEVYIGYLRHKLEANGEKRLIQTVRGAGYVLKE
ncbi:response regulator transcription factor [Brevibacillus sp. SYSU BS000544]|uniref:response regulator transcription factor n=1 Tax=Brevibacillus sp. SYSU BS000544 TaxID=3416443 RepID=UPI003CE585B5